MDEIINLNVAFAKWITPRLIRFNEVRKSHPAGITDEKWSDIIQKMIEGFNIMAQDDAYSLTWKQEESVEVAINLFSQWVRDLWS